MQVGWSGKEIILKETKKKNQNKPKPYFFSVTKVSWKGDMIASVFSQDWKYKGGGTSKLKDNADRRTYGLFIYTPQRRIWAENLGKVSRD